MEVNVVDAPTSEITNTNQLAIYKAIYDAMSDAVMFADVDRNIMLLNDAGIALFGYSIEELRGHKTQILYANSDDFSVQGKKRYSQSANKNTSIYEVRYRRKDGSEFTGETLGSLVKDIHGTLIGYIGVIRDVTERNKSNQIINRFGRIMEDSLNEIYLFDDKSLRFIDVNRGARENLGYSIEELRKLTAYDIKPEISKDAFNAMIAPLRNDAAGIIRFETVHERKDKSTYPVEVHLQRVKLEDSVFYLAIILDITERKRIELELEKHRNHLELLVSERSAVLKEQAQIINQIHDSVISTDMDGFIQSWNRGASNLFGYEPDEMLGKHVKTLYTEHDHELLLDQVIKPLSEKGENEVEVRMIRKSGVPFYAHLSLSLLFDDDGNPKGMVGYSIDITDRKLAEERAKQHADELEMTNEELRRFNYSVSHDLKAPLRAIDGFSFALMEEYSEKLDEEGKDYLSRVRNATQRMGHLIEDLLNLSRVSLESMKKEPVDLSEIANEVTNLLRERSPGRNVEVKIQNNMQVEADYGLTRILIENMLDNAWKYSSQSEYSLIEFFCENISGEKTYVIKDNGVGFDREYASHLFDAFYRLHSKEEFAGSGIGLATVQRIVHRHHGKIWAESEVGKGATFFFTLG